MKKWEDLTEEEKAMVKERIFKVLYECNPDWFDDEKFEKAKMEIEEE